MKWASKVTLPLCQCIPSLFRRTFSFYYLKTIQTTPNILSPPHGFRLHLGKWQLPKIGLQKKTTSEPPCLYVACFFRACYSNFVRELIKLDFIFRNATQTLGGLFETKFRSITLQRKSTISIFKQSVIFIGICECDLFGGAVFR